MTPRPAPPAAVGGSRGVPLAATGRTRSRARVAASRALAALLGVALAAVAGEVALRALDVEPPRVLTKLNLIDARPGVRAWYGCYTSNDRGELQPLPDLRSGAWRAVNSMVPPAPVPLERLRDTPWCVEYRISSIGLREREIAAEPAPGTVRIAAVGDSFVFGEGVPVEGTIARQLEARLGPGHEVLNLGWPGIDTATELSNLRQALPRVRPSRAIVFFIANDVAMTPELAQRQEWIHDLINVRDEHLARHRASAWWSGASQLLRVVGASLDMARLRRETIGWYLDMYEPAHNASGLEKLAADLRALRGLEGCRVVLVLYPLLEGLEGGYPLQPIHDRVAGLARDAGLPVVDLAPAFAGRPTSELWVHSTDHHPNGRAHAIAAEAVAGWLARELPGFLAR